MKKTKKTKKSTSEGDALVSPQAFLERLALSRLREQHGMEGMDEILEEEVDLIEQVYTYLTRKSQAFSDKHDDKRHATDVVISVSFSIFATVCLTALQEDGAVDKRAFENMLQENLNKLFEDSGSKLIVERT